MKRIFGLLVCLTLILATGLLYADDDSRYGREAGTPGYVNTKLLTTTTHNTIGHSAEIYAITIYPTSAYAYANIYNAATANGTPIMEVAEATQYDSKREVFDPPLSADTAVSVSMYGCYTILEYR